MISRILQNCGMNTPLPYVHFKFTDEGVFGNTDMELDFLWLIHAICHATRDDGDGIATRHSGVDVVAVNVPVFLKEIGGTSDKDRKCPGWQADTEGGKDQMLVGGITTISLVQLQIHPILFSFLFSITAWHWSDCIFLFRNVNLLIYSFAALGPEFVATVCIFNPFSVQCNVIFNERYSILESILVRIS